jgi:hypothetical protein
LKNYGCGVVPVDDGVVDMLLPPAGILVDVGPTGDVVLPGTGDVVLCPFIALEFVVLGDVVDGAVVFGNVEVDLTVPDVRGVAVGLPLLNAPLLVPLFNVPVPLFSVPLFTPLFIVPLVMVPFVVPLLRVPLVVPLFNVPFEVPLFKVPFADPLFNVLFVVPCVLTGVVCADAIPNANTAATVKINFFILLLFVVSDIKLRRLFTLTI